MDSRLIKTDYFFNIQFKIKRVLFFNGVIGYLQIRVTREFNQSYRIVHNERHNYFSNNHMWLIVCEEKIQYIPMRFTDTQR